MPNIARQNMTLNLVPSGNLPVLHVSQYDSGWVVYFSLYNGTSSFSIPADATVRIQGTKSDKHGISKLCTKSQQYDNQAFVYISEQMTAAPGPAIYELCVVGSDDKQIGTVNFIMDVEPAALRDDAVISDSEIAVAQQVLHDLQSVETYATRLDTMENRMDAYETLPEGSTTGDAELIDIRAGADGVTYTNAGTAVRTQVTNLQTQITENAKDIANLNRSAVETPTHMQLESVTLAAGTLIPVTGIHGRVLNANGIPTYTGQIQHHVSEPIYCRWPDGNGVITAHLRGSAYYGNAFYAFYDSEWAVVGLQVATTEDVTSEFAGAVTVPANARYMRIAWNSSVNEPRLYFDAGSTWYFPAGTDAMDGRLDAVEGGLTTAQGNISTLQTNMTTAQGNISTLQTNMTAAQGDITTLQGNVSDLDDDLETLTYTVNNSIVAGPVAVEVTSRLDVDGVKTSRAVPLQGEPGRVLNASDGSTEPGASKYFVSNPIFCSYPDSGGVTNITIVASASYGHAYFAFYDDAFEFISAVAPQYSTETSTYGETIETPVGATYIRVAWDSSVNDGMIRFAQPATVYVPSEQLLPSPRLRGKKWLVLGDGMSRRADYSVANAYYDLLQDTTTTVTVQTSVASSFVNGGGLSQIIADLTGTYDLITLMAGLPDAAGLAAGTLTLGHAPNETDGVDTNPATIYGMIYEDLWLLANARPQAEKVVIIEPWAYVQAYDPTATGTGNDALEKAHRKIQQAVRDMAEYFGLTVVDLGKYGGFLPRDQSAIGTDARFTASGMEKIARKLKAELQGLNV